MCRYARGGAYDYRTHFACLACRRSFKHLREQSPHCPSCREPMLDMGHDFKPPRREAKAQWEKVIRLAEADILFHSCGCTGPGWRPATVSEAKSMLKQRRTHRKHGVAFHEGWLPGRELLDA